MDKPSRSNEIRDLWRNGRDIASIATDLGVSRGYVSRVVGATARDDRLLAKMYDLERQIQELRSEIRRLLIVSKKL
jgi:hypothetical protein